MSTRPKREPKEPKQENAEPKERKKRLKKGIRDISIRLPDEIMKLVVEQLVKLSPQHVLLIAMTNK